MPDGYRVTLGDSVLNVGDAITDPFVFFNTQKNLGPGKWTVTGVFNSRPFGPATETGDYVLGTDGFVYFVPDFGPLDSISSSGVVSAPTFDAEIQGTANVEAQIAGTDTLNINPTDPEAGAATLLEGTVLTLSQIETIICFTSGTLIQTPLGERRIETLGAGDVVLTLDNGPQPIRWIGTKTVPASGVLAPVHFRSGVIGNTRDLLVSPQHRMLCSGYRPQVHFGEREVLAPAKSLVDHFNVTVQYGGMVTYVHMLFDTHQIVIANGAPSESFYPGGSGLDAIEDAARAEVFTLFPKLRSDVASYGPASRLCVEPQEARAMAQM